MLCVLITTHNVGFYGELEKIFPEISQSKEFGIMFLIFP